LLDESVAQAIRREYVGDFTWLGLLIGAKSTDKIVGYAMVPQSRQNQLTTSFNAGYAELLASAIEHHAADRLELKGVLTLASSRPPMKHTIRDYQKKWGGLLPKGVWLYHRKYRNRLFSPGRDLYCFPLKGSRQLEVREVSHIGSAERDLVERVLEDMWQAIDSSAQAGSVVQSRLSSVPAEGPLRCLIEPELETSLMDFASRYRRREVGGALLGFREGRTSRVVAAVFPPQEISTAVRCEFETHALASICDALDELRESSRAGAELEGLRVVGWVHTHPGLTVFLSLPDVRTFKQWASLDPNAIAIVVDPLAGWDQRLICNSKLRPIVVQYARPASGRSLDEQQANTLADSLARAEHTPVPWHVIAAHGVASTSTGIVFQDKEDARLGSSPAARSPDVSPDAPTSTARPEAAAPGRAAPSSTDADRVGADRGRPSDPEDAFADDPPRAEHTHDQALEEALEELYGAPSPAPPTEGPTDFAPLRISDGMLQQLSRLRTFYDTKDYEWRAIVGCRPSLDAALMFLIVHRPGTSSHVFARLRRELYELERRQPQQQHCRLWLVRFIRPPPGATAPVGTQPEVAADFEYPVSMGWTHGSQFPELRDAAGQAIGWANERSVPRDLEAMSESVTRALTELRRQDSSFTIFDHYGPL